jgi:peptidoglycan/LPS O-acetylase OafA/YrhL
MRPFTQTVIVSVVAGLILELVAGAVITAWNPSPAVQNTIGLLALALIAAVGAAWHRRVDPGAERSRRLAAALGIPVLFAVLTLWFNLHAGASDGKVAGNVLMAIVAIAVGLAVGDTVRRPAGSEPGGYR